MKKSMLEKLKAAKKNLEEKKTTYADKIDFFKPKVGDNLIRILPRGEDMPYVEVRLHYITVKKKDGTIAHGIPVRCWAELGDDKCPICEYAQNLMRSKKEADQANGKRFRAGTRYLYNIVDYTGKVVVPWAISSNLHEEILGNLIDLADEDILNVETGKNWKLIKKQKGKEAFQVDYTLRLDPRSSAIPAKLMPLVEEAVNLEELYQDKEERIVNAFLGFKADSEEDDDDDYTPKKKRPVIEEEEDDDTPPPPKKKKVVVEEEEDDDDMAAKLKAKSKAKKVVEDEDDEPAPKKKAYKKDEDLDLDDVEDFDVDSMLDEI